MSDFKILIIAVLLVLPMITISQNPDDRIDELKSNKELYRSFNKFYADSIKNETTENFDGEVFSYYYKVDQINGVHNIDYNKDGLMDSLVEFSAYVSDGGTAFFLVAALFENVNGSYKYIAHLNVAAKFEKFEKSIYYFSNADYRDSKYQDIIREQYKLINGKFENNKNPKF